MKMKKISLQKRKEYVEALQKEIEHQNEVIALIESYSPDTLEKRIIHEYAIEGAVAEVAKKLNEEGLRVGARKYISNDVSEVVRSKPIIDKLHEVTKKALEHNTAGLRY
ncbi:hypothetical protein [Cohnella herbarum]|uniref:Uncharacterized protein n=1 Tax=Cohnella herbarum TaxID=2728023 RepID=A0A7Z2VRH3_9BACL|nr:hypothetical protein [Cohnella herbarum]QJD87585.1 hypothetical protein HH215_33325 [Cohnella herbarum]